MLDIAQRWAQKDAKHKKLLNLLCIVYLLENLILVINKNIIKRYKNVGYNLYIMWQSACLVVNPIMVYSSGFFLNWTMVGQASLNDGSDIKLLSVGWCLMLVCG